MKRRSRLRRRIAWAALTIAGMAAAAVSALEMHRWMAWNLLSKDFQAVCTAYSALTGDDVDRYIVVEGPYTREFWERLKIAYAAFPNKLDPNWAEWREDGSLRVPIAFDFEPEEKDGLFYLRHDRRPRERSHVLASMAAFDILEDREAASVDLSPYKRYAFSADPSRYEPSVKANTCGVMHDLITVGGSLAGTLQ